MSIETFLEPRLVGSRFDGHAVPLELLKDLAVLGDLIVDVAKWQFLQDNPTRKRTPRGFTEGIELKLTGVEEGSAKVLISLVTASVMLFPPTPPCFEKARDAVVHAIAAAEGGKKVTDHLPDHVLGYFDRIGRSLRIAEAIEFTTPNHTSPARLTKETRRTLLLASEKIKEYTEETKIRGSIPEADQDNMTFELQMVDGRKIKAPIYPQHLPIILEGFNGYKDGVRVLLEGVGKFSRQDRLQSLESVERITILDNLDVEARLDELRLIKDSWLGDNGIALAESGLDWLLHTFNLHFPDHLPLPYIYPTPEGGIQFEWPINPNEISLEINLADHCAEWHDLNVETNADKSKKLDLNDDASWKWFVNEICQLTGEAI